MSGSMIAYQFLNLLLLMAAVFLPIWMVVKVHSIEKNLKEIRVLLQNLDRPEDSPKTTN